MKGFQGLVVASVVGLGIIAGAQAGPFTPVDFSQFYNFNPQSQYGFPSGAQSFAGVPFQMTVDQNGNDSWQSVFMPCNLCSITVPVGVAGVATIYTLLSTWWGEAGTLGGTVTANGSAGDHFTYKLIAGDNIRTYPILTNQGIGNIRDYNPNAFTSDFLGDPSAQQVFLNCCGQRVDMQTIALPDVFAGETLDSITFTTINVPSYWTEFLQGITVEAPEPGTLTLFGVGLAALAWSRRRSAAKDAAPAV